VAFCTDNPKFFPNLLEMFTIAHDIASETSLVASQVSLASTSETFDVVILSGQEGEKKVTVQFGEFAL